jgi:hypothetical protein
MVVTLAALGGGCASSASSVSRVRLFLSALSVWVTVDVAGSLTGFLGFSLTLPSEVLAAAVSAVFEVFLDSICACLISRGSQNSEIVATLTLTLSGNMIVVVNE